MMRVRKGIIIRRTGQLAAKLCIKYPGITWHFQIADNYICQSSLLIIHLIY